MTARVAIYTITRNKLDLVKRSIKLLRRSAGIEYDHYVVDQASTDGTAEWLEQKDGFTRKYLSKENLGQNIAANIMLDQMIGNPYKWIIRWDPDAIPHSRNIIKRMVRFGDEMWRASAPAIFSPLISKLEHPPPAKATAKVESGVDKGREVELVDILGGICRMHPAYLFMDLGFRFNKFGALGFGEAIEMSQAANAQKLLLVRLPWLEVEHAMGHSGQVEAYPEEFNFVNREIPRLVSYGF